MNKTRIKVCGICTVADAKKACNAGADAIGMVFYAKSPRNVTVKSAMEIVSSLPPFISAVGLFVNSSQQEVNQVLSRVRLDLLQFHGDEDEVFCNSFDRPYIKVVRVKRDTDLASSCQQYASARGILLDSYKKGTAGGSGEAFDWSLIPNDLSLPVILAGGLNPENVAVAVSRVQPWAVDVSSGVEESPGKKDAYKIEQFISAVKRAEK
ncbi:MAG: phosphoribosylanthranilate isomerase [Gammaproteobacteria bacterium]|nr:MAG: phosphoribosylanthranilate isomerase [Gammaproteobacteria bacterium]